MGSDSPQDCMSIAGFYGEAGQSAALCPRGSFCPKRTVLALACPLNTWSQAGSDDLKDCASKAGFYGTPGVAAVTCPHGSYCPADQNFFVQCPANT
eukprot:CAMPEP_0113722230 /NCGR_PEP_ID=MMETSP0038_2-20120614/37621_1 /TAXON_ID=2898 /ORGANISM="Cryptomonas paramecium" /LENGTH=95 /DNA_ID=CAMNT_0000651423 /DNA_START=33 /DNA_END=316 /DNA_ORIENTATION=+ /assembly_acc=CAM_ASM_000170